MVTLIHGTFASDADWTQPDSPLARQLTERCDGELLVSPPFVWSGNNSHQARLQAGLELAEHLKEQVARHPKARHVLICHSHGGNVALYALRKGKLRRRIHSVVCLATPFIHCSPRNFTIGLQSIGLVFGGIVAVTTFVLLFFAFPLWFEQVFEFDFLEAGIGSFPLVLGWVFAVFLGPIACVAGLAYLIRRFLTPRAEKAQAEMLDRLSLPSTHSTLVYSLQYTSDEARGALSAFQWVANLPHITLAALLIPYRWLLEASYWIFDKIPGPGYVLFLLVLLSAVVFVPFWLLILLMHFIFRRHRLAFGEMLSEDLLLKIRAKPEPPSQINATQGQFSVDHLIGGRGALKYLRFWLSRRLIHSAIYTDEKSIDWIVKAIRGELKTSGAT